MGAVHAEGPVFPPKGELNPWPLAREYPRRPTSQPNPQLSSEVRRRYVCARMIHKMRTKNATSTIQPTECARVCQRDRDTDSDGPAVGAVCAGWVFKCMETTEIVPYASRCISRFGPKRRRCSWIGCRS